MSAILAVDPGETSGLAWCDTAMLLKAQLDRRTGNMVEHTQVGGSAVEAVDAILLLMRKVDVRIVVMESFQIRPGQVLKGAGAYAPLTIDAMLKYGLSHKWMKVGYEYQSASTGKSVMTDVRLKALGLWWPGEDHARDAARHLITFIRRYRQGKLKNQMEEFLR